jgi:zinc transporter, ZIP family
VLSAAGWGALGASSLLIGALLGLYLRIPTRAIGLLLGFGAGTLISAVAFELTDEAYARGGADTVAAGLALGALAYFAGDAAIARRGGADRMKPMERDPSEASSALLLGAVLDGIPESAVIGLSLIGGGGVGVPVLAAVFLSNLPEAVSSSAGMRAGGAPRAHVLRIWLLVVAVSAVAAGVGYGTLEGASGDAVGLLQAFAAGAVLTMLVDTMVPEAYRFGGRAVGLVTVLGFAVAYLLSTLE